VINSLSIENFRGIKSLELENLGQVNVIAGKNNSCKSSVLESLALFLGAEQGFQTFREILEEILIWRGWYGEQAVEDLLYKDSKEAKIMTDNGSLTIEFGTLPQLPNQKGLSLKLNDKPGISFGILDISRFLVEGYSRVFLSSKFSPELNFELLTPLTFRKFGYVESLYSHAYEQKVVKKTIDILKVAYPEVEGFSPLFKFNKWILYVETKYGVYPYYLMGEGFKSAMILAFLSSLINSGYLLVDSADAFHHPKSLGVMVKTLIKGANENNVQVFLTTHSLELIDMLLEEGIEAGIDGRIIYMKQEDSNVIAKIETFERANDLRETIGLDLRG